jgi:hypothetical protein
MAVLMLNVDFALMLHVNGFYSGTSNVENVYV